MVRCPDCGADGRVALVDEHAACGVKVTYLCPNRRCVHYLQEIGTETLGTERRTEDAEGEAQRAAG
ncbi:MAG: hypothetical protein HDT26_04140 [Subdoligranulum sp.]|nr:hypothetical protein [Subdoligranulum sp.]